MPPDRPLGCSKCRYSSKGCGRCRNPSFKPRRPRVAANASATQPGQQLSTSHGESTEQARKRSRKQTEGTKDTPEAMNEVKNKANTHPAAHDSTLRSALAPPADESEQQAELRQLQKLLQVHQGTRSLQQHQQQLCSSSFTLLQGNQSDHQQQQQQQQQEVALSGQCQVSENRHAYSHNRSNSLAKRLRKALQQPAAPLAALPAANTAGVDEAGVGGAAGAGAATPVPEQESPADCGATDGEAHQPHKLQEQLNKAAAAAAAAAVATAAVQPHGQPLGATSEAVVLPSARIAAAAAAAVSPAAHFTQVLQQRIQAQLTQGRQKLPSKARGSSSSSSSKGAASGARLSHAAHAAAMAPETATPPKQQQQYHLDAGKAPGAQRQQQQQEQLQDSAPSTSTESSIDAADTAVPHLTSPQAAVPTDDGPPASSPSTARGARSKPRASGRKPKPSYKPPKPYTHLAVPGVDPRVPVPGWRPPVSPFGLLEEELWQQPWQLLLGCMLLNKTTSKQVRAVLWQLLELCPTPEAAAAADPAAIRAVITPLGLHNKRALAVQRLSQDFLYKQWSCPTELYGIGKYAADAYYIFCRGQWQGVQPDDKDLIKYHEWLRATGGQGTGFTAAAADSVEQQQQQQQQ